MTLDATEQHENGRVHDLEHRLVVVAGGVGEIADVQNGFAIDSDGRLVVIGPNGGSLGFTTFETDHTWTVGGTVAVPSGDTNFIPPMFVTNATGQTVSLARAKHKLNSGTSATVSVQRNGSNVTGFTDLTVTTTATTTNPTDVALTDGDTLAIVVTAVNGTPKNMTFTIVLKHTAD